MSVDPLTQALQRASISEHVVVVSGGRDLIDIISGAANDLGLYLPFKYFRLNDDTEVRVVELLPGTRNQDLSCNILPLSLNDRKHDAYIALSYM
jgi:hypothetical protein